MTALCSSANERLKTALHAPSAGGEAIWSPVFNQSSVWTVWLFCSDFESFTEECKDLGFNATAPPGGRPHRSVLVHLPDSRALCVFYFTFTYV